MIKELKKRNPNQDRRVRQQSKKEINIEDLIEGKCFFCFSLIKAIF